MTADYKDIAKLLLIKLGVRMPLSVTMPTGYDLMYDLERMFRRQPPGMIIDVGANLGQTGTRFSQAFPHVPVHCIEPVQATWRRGTELTRANPDILWHHMAVSNRTGEATVSADPFSELNRLVGDGAGSPPAVTEIVKLERLDHLFAGDPRLVRAILKTDTEGHDLEVLQGSAAVLDRVWAVVSEIGLTAQNSTHTPFANVSEFLAREGFAFVNLYDTHQPWHTSWGPRMANALYVRQDRFST